MRTFYTRLHTIQYWILIYYATDAGKHELCEHIVHTVVDNVNVSRHLWTIIMPSQISCEIYRWTCNRTRSTDYIIIPRT